MNSKRLAIFGGRGGGEQIAAVALRADPDIDVVGYLNDVEPIGALIGGLPVLGPFDAWSSLGDDVCFASALHKTEAMAERIGRVEETGVPERRWYTAVDPSALLLGGVVIGRNCLVSFNAVLKSNARVGDHVAIRDGVSIGHDVVLGDHVFVGANATVGGYTEVGRGTYIGLGAIVRERLRVGAMAVVGMGAVVVDDVPDGVVVVGNPARILPGRK